MLQLVQRRTHVMQIALEDFIEWKVANTFQTALATGFVRPTARVSAQMHHKVLA